MGPSLTSADLGAMAKEAEISPGSHLLRRLNRKEEERKGRTWVGMCRKGPQTERLRSGGFWSWPCL